MIVSADSLAWLLNIRGGDVPNCPLALGFAIINQDGSFNEIKYPNKEPKVECLSIKKTSKNRNKNKKLNPSKEQQKPAMNLQEYFERHRTKK